MEVGELRTLPKMEAEEMETYFMGEQELEASSIEVEDIENEFKMVVEELDTFAILIR